MEVLPDSSQWLFPDFDRMFELVVAELSGQQKTYDLFGHSAGGQVLHRMALFHPDAKARRIVAGNSGFYTLPSFEVSLPFGLQGSTLSKVQLEKSFSKQLVVLVGEMDNADEQGGTLLRSPTVDRQGVHRLSRGQYFYQMARVQANALKSPLNWKLITVPGVGHNHRKMGEAAATFLYP